MRRVLLISPPYPKFPNDHKHASPPLGLAYIAAVLEAKGYKIKIIDCVVEGFDVETEMNGSVVYGLTSNRLLNLAREYAPDVIGISCMFSTLDHIVKEVSRRIKEACPASAVVLGGAHPTVMSEQLISRPFIDYIVRGEGELSFLALLEHLEKGREIESVPSLTWLREGEIHHTPQEFIADLDQLPIPARHLLNIEKYMKIGHMQGLTKKGSRATTLISSRGCPGRCTFCSIHAVSGRKFRAHSPRYTLDEIKHLQDRYGVNHLLFEDDNLTLDTERAKKIFKGIMEEIPSLTWTAPNGVAIWALDDELLTLMRDSRCHWLTLGVESGDPETLRTIIRKPLRLDRVNQTVKRCKQLGIHTTALFVIGMPGETIQSMKRSMKYAENLDVNSLCISMAVPYPGTTLFKICEENGYLVEGFALERLTTQFGQIRTPQFSPIDVERLIAKTLTRHALKHPVGVLRRVYERLKASPKHSLSMIAGHLASALWNKPQKGLFK